MQLLATITVPILFVKEDMTYFKCLTFDCSSVFLRITLASMNGLGSEGQYSTIHI